MLKHIMGIALCALVLTIAASAGAAPEIIEADGVYTMGDNDTPKSARDGARREAMRAATERAGIYIESTSTVAGYALTRDEIRTVAAAVLRIMEEEITPELIGESWRYRVHLVCAVDTDGIDLKELAANKAELDRLRQERDLLRSENASLQRDAVRHTQQQPTMIYVYGEAAQRSARAAQGDATDAILADAEAMIARGDTEHAIADLSLLLMDPSVTGDARAYAYVLRGRCYYERRSSALAQSDFTAAEHTPHTSASYPIWRLYQYRSRIHYDAGQYDDAVSDLMSAWDASDKTDAELFARLRRYERKAAQERRHTERGDGGARSWDF